MPPDIFDTFDLTTRSMNVKIKLQNLALVSDTIPLFCFFFSSSSPAGGASPVPGSCLGAFAAGPVGQKKIEEYQKILQQNVCDGMMQ